MYDTLAFLRPVPWLICTPFKKSTVPHPQEQIKRELDTSTVQERLCLRAFSWGEGIKQCNDDRQTDQGSPVIRVARNDNN